MIYTYTKDSLYGISPLHSVIDYRVSEFENRKFLANMLAQAKSDQNVFGDLVNLESIFGVEISENNIKDSITTKDSKNGATYHYQNQKLVNVQYGKAKIPSKFAAAYAKFLTYETTMHPSIKRTVALHKFGPKNLSYNYTNVSTKTTHQYAFTYPKKKERLYDKVL